MKLLFCRLLSLIFAHITQLSQTRGRRIRKIRKAVFRVFYWRGFFFTHLIRINSLGLFTLYTAGVVEMTSLSTLCAGEVWFMIEGGNFDGLCCCCCCCWDNYRDKCSEYILFSPLSIAEADIFTAHNLRGGHDENINLYFGNPRVFWFQSVFYFFFNLLQIFNFPSTVLDFHWNCRVPCNGGLNGGDLCWYLFTQSDFLAYKTRPKPNIWIRRRGAVEGSAAKISLFPNNFLFIYLTVG